MSDQARETAQTEHQTGFLGLIERAGNRLPDPAFIFLYLIIAMVIISVITAVMGLSALHPTQTNPDGSAVLVEAQRRRPVRSIVGRMGGRVPVQ